MNIKKDRGELILIQLRIGHLLPYLETGINYHIRNYTLSEEMKNEIKNYIIDKPLDSYIYIGVNGSIYVAPYEGKCQHKKFINPKKLENSYRPNVKSVTVSNPDSVFNTLREYGVCLDEFK